MERRSAVARRAGALTSPPLAVLYLRQVSRWTPSTSALSAVVLATCATCLDLRSAVDTRERHGRAAGPLACRMACRTGRVEAGHARARSRLRSRDELDFPRRRSGPRRRFGSVPGRSAVAPHCRELPMVFPFDGSQGISLFDRFDLLVTIALRNAVLANARWCDVWRCVLGNCSLTH
jgi:hypothetical protein